MSVAVHSIEDVLKDPPSTYGQCECCGSERVALWVDDFEGGEFARCRSCWNRLIAKSQRAAAATNVRIRKWLER